MKRQNKGMLGFGLVVVAMACSWGAVVPGEKAKLAVVDAPKRVLLELPGTIAPIRETHVSPRVPGQVLEVSFEVGTQVKAGQILARLDRTSFELEYKSTLALVERAQALIAEEEAQGKLRDALLVQAAAEIRQAVAQCKLFEQKARRMRELQQANAVDARVVDEANSQLESASEKVLQLQSKQKSIEQDRPTHRLMAAKAALACAEAQRDLAKFRFDSTEIRSPIAGMVVAKRVEEGEVVNPLAASANQRSTICVIADLSQLDVIVDLPEKSVNQVSQGQKCLVRVDAIPNVIFKGKVLRINPTVSATTRTVATRIRLDVPQNDRSLRAGMYGRVEIFGDE